MLNWVTADPRGVILGSRETRCGRILNNVEKSSLYNVNLKVAAQEVVHRV